MGLGNEFRVYSCDFVDQSFVHKNNDDPRSHTNQHEPKILPTRATCDFEVKPLGPNKAVPGHCTLKKGRVAYSFTKISTAVCPSIITSCTFLNVERTIFTSSRFSKYVRPRWTITYTTPDVLVGSKSVAEMACDFKSSRPNLLR